MGSGIEGIKSCKWAERLRRCADSQLTVGDFCVWEGVSVAAFYVWRKKLTNGVCIFEPCTELQRGTNVVVWALARARNSRHF